MTWKRANQSSAGESQKSNVWANLKKTMFGWRQKTWRVNIFTMWAKVWFFELFLNFIPPVRGKESRRGRLRVHCVFWMGATEGHIEPTIVGWFPPKERSEDATQKYESSVFDQGNLFLSKRTKKTKTDPKHPTEWGHLQKPQRLHWWGLRL